MLPYSPTASHRPLHPEQLAPAEQLHSPRKSSLAYSPASSGATPLLALPPTEVHSILHWRRRDSHLPKAQRAPIACLGGVARSVPSTLLRQRPVPEPQSTPGIPAYLPAPTIDRQPRRITNLTAPTPCRRTSSSSAPPPRPREPASSPYEGPQSPGNHHLWFLHAPRQSSATDGLPDVYS